MVAPVNYRSSARMLTAVTWFWGNKFAPAYVNTLRSMLERHVHVEHELVCVTNTPAGIDPRVRIVRPPAPLPGDIRCRRRMWQFAAERRHDLGARILAIDLDVVALADLTPIVTRPEPIVGWRVGYANVYSGSFMLFDAGALDGAWQEYRRDPIRFPKLAREQYASDQAMVNYWLGKCGKPIAQWTERDGFVTWFGAGYEALEYHGMGPSRPTPPPGARIVVMGSADKHVMDEGRYPFVREHWR